MWHLGLLTVFVQFTLWFRDPHLFYVTAVIIFTEVKYFIVGMCSNLFFSASVNGHSEQLLNFSYCKQAAMNIFIQTPGVPMVPFF